MTIAAGLHCSDGLIICADTQVSEGNAKSERMKIWGTGDGNLLLTGAGSTDCMKMAFDRLSATVFASRPADSAEARVVVEELVSEMHAKHIYPLNEMNHPNAYDMGFSLIVAIRCVNGSLALVKTLLTTASLVDDYEAVGAGSEVFKYWAKYFLVSSMNLEVMSYLSLFMLREAKNSSVGCGGSSHVCKMPSDLTAPKKYKRLFSETDILAGFPNSAVKVLLAAADINLPDSAIQRELEFFTLGVTELRGALKEERNQLERFKHAIDETNRIAATSSTASEPPERSGSVVPAKSSRRGRRHL